MGKCVKLSGIQKRQVTRQCCRYKRYFFKQIYIDIYDPVLARRLRPGRDGLRVIIYERMQTQIRRRIDDTRLRKISDAKVLFEPALDVAEDLTRHCVSHRTHPRVNPSSWLLLPYLTLEISFQQLFKGELFSL